MTDEQKRIAQLERRLAKAEGITLVYMEWCQRMMAELVKRNIPVPDKPGKDKVR